MNCLVCCLRIFSGATDVSSLRRQQCIAKDFLHGMSHFGERLTPKRPVICSGIRDVTMIKELLTHYTSLGRTHAKTITCCLIQTAHREWTLWESAVHLLGGRRHCER